MGLQTRRQIPAVVSNEILLPWLPVLRPVFGSTGMTVKIGFCPVSKDDWAQLRQGPMRWHHHPVPFPLWRTSNWIACIWPAARPPARYITADAGVQTVMWRNGVKIRGKRSGINSVLVAGQPPPASLIAAGANVDCFRIDACIYVGGNLFYFYYGPGDASFRRKSGVQVGEIPTQRRLLW